VAIFYSLRFETSLFVASYDSQGHGGDIRPICTDRVENTVSSSTSIFVCLSIAAGTCLPSRCLETNVVYSRSLATAVSVAPQFLLCSNMPQHLALFIVVKRQSECSNHEVKMRLPGRCVSAGTLVRNCGATYEAPTQKADVFSLRREDPIFKHINGLGTNIY
jgi:hypothetical protein